MILVKTLDLFDRAISSRFFSNEISKFDYYINSEIRETDTSHEIYFIVPGFKKEEISVSVDGKNLIVEAKKGDNETKYTKYNKSIYFPNGFEGISAKLENGILTVSIPKEKTKKDKIVVEIE